MTRARTPRPHEIAAAQRDPRFLRALRESHADLSWRARGACNSVDPEMFFPEPSERADRALALCRGCDVQGPCLAWALSAGDCHGVWGATTARERRAMRLAWHGVGHDRQPLPDPATDPAPAGVADVFPATGVCHSVRYHRV